MIPHLVFFAEGDVVFDGKMYHFEDCYGGVGGSYDTAAQCAFKEGWEVLVYFVERFDEIKTIEETERLINLCPETGEHRIWLLKSNSKRTRPLHMSKTFSLDEHINSQPLSIDKPKLVDPDALHYNVWTSSGHYFAGDAEAYVKRFNPRHVEPTLQSIVAHAQRSDYDLVITKGAATTRMIQRFGALVYDLNDVFIVDPNNPDQLKEVDLTQPDWEKVVRGQAAQAPAKEPFVLPPVLGKWLAFGLPALLFLLVLTFTGAWTPIFDVLGAWGVGFVHVCIAIGHWFAVYWWVPLIPIVLILMVTDGGIALLLAIAAVFGLIWGLWSATVGLYHYGKEIQARERAAIHAPR
ncbi:hypothetical protein HOU02_gp323 [Caulobacter phage CcrBL9]|uniref:Uncharacterized protein n=1 Tax=Caulobacter phage CcrBL9 TaxID=2283270 RepID=A0A385EEY4_9CAUD|nr:hypothetical protein HOU02_gp323 [Caulobacter phage CcrBL9]AXQ69402.1 hypothetical protein CcrBL9_gp378 [Caulobacter phage CcrBL9]